MGPGVPSLSLGPYKFHDLYETNTRELKGSIGYHKFINGSSFTPGADAGTLLSIGRQKTTTFAAPLRQPIGDGYQQKWRY